MFDPIRKCPFCGKLYATFSMMVGDQSVCSACMVETHRNDYEWLRGYRLMRRGNQVPSSFEENHNNNNEKEEGK